MTTYVALLRAVNVGGTGKLPMAELVAICTGCGFQCVRTWIASGNVVFRTDLAEAEVRLALEAALRAHAGKPVGVIVRTAAAIAEVLTANPFADAPGNRAVAIFLDAPPPADTLAGVTGRGSEQLALGHREIYVRYDDGMADSKLKIPAANAGTGCNLNTITKLAQMAASQC